MKLVQKRSKKTGLPPGTLVHIGEKKAETVTMTVFDYAGARCDERTVTNPDELQPPADESVTWVDIGGVHKLDLLEALLCQTTDRGLRAGGAMLLHELEHAHSRGTSSECGGGSHLSLSGQCLRSVRL